MLCSSLALYFRVLSASSSVGELPSSTADLVAVHESSTGFPKYLSRLQALLSANEAFINVFAGACKWSLRLLMVMVMVMVIVLAVAVEAVLSLWITPSNASLKDSVLHTHTHTHTHIFYMQTCDNKVALRSSAFSNTRISSTK